MSENPRGVTGAHKEDTTALPSATQLVPNVRKTVSATLWNKLSRGEYSLTNLFFNYVSAPVDVRALSNFSLLSTWITSMFL